MSTPTPDPEPRPGAKRSFFQLQSVKDGTTHLLNEIKKSSVFGGNLTRDACTNVIFSVIMMDEYLRGVKGQHKYQKIRLPFELFEDFRIGGSLDCVLRGTLETMVSHSISVLNNSVPLEKLQAILDRIWEHVTLKGLWHPIRILFDSAMAETRRAELDKLAVELGAVVVKDKSENPTHIIVDQEIEKPKGFIVRDIDIDTKMARLHWVGTPSSYDDWVPKTDSMVITPVAGTSGELVAVSAEWLVLSHKFNEWMPTFDYRIHLQLKRPAEEPAQGDASNSKAVKSEHHQHEAAAPAGPGTGRLDPNVQTRLDKVLLSNLEEEPIQNLRELYRVPAHASWYRPSEIHEIEKRYLPEFFNGKSANKTPRLYKQARQLFISKFRENTSKAITFTECRCHLTGDVGALQRVFNFLESWGLINYFPREELKERVVSVNSLQSNASKAQGDSVHAVLGNTQGVQVVNTTIPASTSLYSFRRENQNNDSRSGPAITSGVEILTRKPTLGDAAENATRDIDYTCDSCGGDCSYFRFHCQTRPDFDLCPLCFHKGIFPSGTVATDFIKLKLRPEDITKGDKESGWTDHETLMLLEALEMHGDDWKKVSEHVGTRSKSECVFHFLRMPIEDPYIEELENAGVNVMQRGVERGNGMEDLVRDIIEEDSNSESTGLPFGDLGNPVMAQISFLAAMLGPKVAAAAAKAALQTISKDDPTLSREAKAQLEAFRTTSEPKNPEPPGDDAPDANNSTTPTEEAALKDSNNDKPDHHTTATSPKGEIDTGKVQEYLSNMSSSSSKKPLSSLQIKTAAATALATAAIKAKLLADQEAREIQRLASTVVELQLKKANIKLRRFQLLEEILERERQQMEQERAMMYTERVRQAAQGLSRQQ